MALSSWRVQIITDVVYVRVMLLLLPTRWSKKVSLVYSERRKSTDDLKTVFPLCLPPLHVDFPCGNYATFAPVHGCVPLTSAAGR